MRRLPAGEAGRAQEQAVTLTRMLKKAPLHPPCLERAFYPVLVMVILAVMGGCAVPLEEQKSHIRKNSLPFQVLTTQAFFETWGKPTYVHQEHTQFYPVKTGNYVPRFRAPLGEAPPGWDASVVSEPAVFLGYVDRGELLGFIDDHLVYREQMTASQIHEIGKNWQHEAIFKTRLETDLSASPKP